MINTKVSGASPPAHKQHRPHSVWSGPQLSPHTGKVVFYGVALTFVMELDLVAEEFS